MHTEQPSRTRTFFCAFTGMAISAAGLTVVLDVIWKIKQLFDKPELLKLFLVLVPEEEKVRTLVVDQQNIILPTLAFHYGAYGLCLFILLIGGLLGSALIKHGIKLLVAA